MVATIICQNNNCDLTKKRGKISHFQSLPPVNFTLGTARDSEKIVYKLITNENPDQEVILTEKNVAGQNLIKTLKTVMVIHGWASDFSAPRYNFYKYYS